MLRIHEAFSRLRRDRHNYHGEHFQRVRPQRQHDHPDPAERGCGQPWPGADAYQRGGYNAANWETSSTDDGLTTSYAYDAAGQLKTHTVQYGNSPVSFTLDPRGRATTISEAGGANASSFGYTPNDQVNSVDMPGGVYQGALYDGANRVYSATAAGPTTAHLTQRLIPGHSVPT